MLRLCDITKNYKVAGGEIEVLKGLNIAFRKNEFVSILGPSGCGKTTTLNIVGGLDKYTSGDLIIAGKSTKNFTDRDWDVYRNQRIGFVFQSYNLIPHQTVLGNVELALTISGVSKEERVARSIKALDKVGLKGEYYKRPNQLSGGQCQRVAIARALVNEPDILLADEPTGALDSKTSVQIMDLIKEISKDKLVIMVTHNAEIAEQYSTRIVRLVDGEITEDTNPYTFEEEQAENQVENIQTKNKKEKKAKAKMSLWTAFKLSLRNLFTKKGRTILTSFAGSIGIIGIALILAVSQGTTAYINHVQEATLSSYPLTIESTSMDLTALMKSFMGVGNSGNKHPNDKVYKDPIIGELVNALAQTGKTENDLKSFKKYLESEIEKEDSKLNNAISGIQYSYDLELDIYTKNIDNQIIKSDTSELMTDMIARYMLGVSSQGGNSGSNANSSSNESGMFSMMMGGGGMWQELLPAKDGGVINDLIKSQYDKIYGEWPSAYNEIVLVVNDKNELDDLTLYALGLISETEINAILDAAINNKELETVDKSWTYKEICERTFKTILPYECYRKAGNSYTDLRKFPESLEILYQSGLELKVTGIIKPDKESQNHMISGSIGYTYKLTEYIIEHAKDADVVKDQLANPNVDVLTGLPFKSTTGNLTDAEKETAFRNYVNALDQDGKADIYLAIQCIMPEQQLMAELGQKMMEYTVMGEGGVVDQVATRAKKEVKVAGFIASQMGLSADDVKGYLHEIDDESLNGIFTGIIATEVQTAYAQKTAMDLMQTMPSNEDRANALINAMQTYTTEQCAKYYDNVTKFSSSSYEDNLILLGYLDIESPSSINIYASSFENKDVIVDAINSYNKSVEETKEIKYTDYMGLMMSSITTIIDAITYVLIAFVAISLVVSSIMIGVITLISVQERTKEIGILRSIGASKRDVSNLFNAETILIGFAAGLVGVLTTYLLCIPINLILQLLTGIVSLKAILPINAAIILITISVVLTLISGIIPSKSAAQKDPVVALRTE